MILWLSRVEDFICIVKGVVSVAELSWLFDCVRGEVRFPLSYISNSWLP